jgi:hypothetical protein
MPRTGPVWIVLPSISMIVLVGGMLLLSGCQSSNGGTRAAREVMLAEFSRPVERSQFADQEHHHDHVHEVDAPPVDVESNSRSAERPQHVLGAASGPMEDARLGPAPGTRVIVDSLVGQVNGRPIYADTFFEPIQDQLRAIARRGTQREIIEQATEVVTQHLAQIVRNELFLADARALLTPQQQQGLIAWMRMMREQEILAGGGTATSAARRLQEQHGMTMEEYLEARRDIALLQKLKEDRISPRVIVSWRDIEREYKRRFHEFNPPARMKVSRIRLSTDRDAELIETATEKLDDGVPFAEVASEVGMLDDGAWQVFQIGEEGVDGLQLSEAIKSQLRNLQVGQTSEPFEVGSSTWWIHLAEIDQPAGQSLYDPEVQRMLHETIWQRRFNEELNRYMESLFAEGVQQELDRMRDRLLLIAFERYWQR